MGEHVDVVIVGAGVSGIGAACHLIRELPGKRFVILERRDQIGGTWDLFSYPGIRSDSDMFTFGFNFRPWTGTKVLADGPSIKAYVEATAAEYGVTDHIRFGLKVLSADWSSAEERWTVQALDERSGQLETFTAGFLVGATGYYNYEAGYRPEFPGEQDFQGPIIHPQHWPTDLDYAGKRVVVIGSGATAVTLIPAMAPDTAHITMLQRSPTYIAARPAVDKMSVALRRFLPEMAVYRFGRARNIALQRFFFGLSRSRPALARKIVLDGVRRQLGSHGDIKDFTPSYNPWDQRLCVVPGGDLFRCIREGTAEVVTDTIERFTASGILLSSGRELEADIVISATGLDMLVLGGLSLTVDGEPVPIHDRMSYKSVMLEGVPNAGMIFGYTNASWTLKADIASQYLCRLIDHMDRKGYSSVVPVGDPAQRTDRSTMSSLASGYVERADAKLPRQGKQAPWLVLNNYLYDAPRLRVQPIEDGVLRFSRRGVARRSPADASMPRSAV